MSKAEVGDTFGPIFNKLSAEEYDEIVLRLLSKIPAEALQKVRQTIIDTCGENNIPKDIKDPWRFAERPKLFEVLFKEKIRENGRIISLSEVFKQYIEDREVPSSKSSAQDSLNSLRAPSQPTSSSTSSSMLASSTMPFSTVDLVSRKRKRSSSTESKPKAPIVIDEEDSDDMERTVEEEKTIPKRAKKRESQPPSEIETRPESPCAVRTRSRVVEKSLLQLQLNTHVVDLLQETQQDGHTQEKEEVEQREEVAEEGGGGGGKEEDDNDDDDDDEEEEDANFVEKPFKEAAACLKPCLEDNFPDVASDDSASSTESGLTKRSAMKIQKRRAQMKTVTSDTDDEEQVIHHDKQDNFVERRQTRSSTSKAKMANKNAGSEEGSSSEEENSQRNSPVHINSDSEESTSNDSMQQADLLKYLQATPIGKTDLDITGGTYRTIFNVVKCKHYGPIRNDVLQVNEPWEDAMMLLGAYDSIEEANKALSQWTKAFEKSECEILTTKQGQCTLLEKGVTVDLFVLPVRLYEKSTQNIGAFHLNFTKNQHG